jgi:PAS domain S-box-containing protein
VEDSDVQATRIAPTGAQRTFSPDEILVTKTNSDDVIVYANDAFIEVSGYSEDEIIGATHEIVRHPDMPRGLSKHLTAMLKSGQEMFVYVPQLTKDGTTYWVLAHVTHSRDAAGRVVGEHSHDRAPDAESVAQASALYSRLVAEERRHSDPETGKAASIRLFDEFLDAKGMTYEEWVWSITKEWSA